MKTLRHDDRRRRSRARRLPLGGLAGKRRDQTSDSVKTTRLSKPPGDEGGRRDQARKGGSASHPCGTGATTPQHACSDSGTSRRITVMLALLLSQEQSANIRLTRRRSALASLPPPSPGISTRTKTRPRDLALTTVIPYQDDKEKPRRMTGKKRRDDRKGAKSQELRGAQDDRAAKASTLSTHRRFSSGARKLASKEFFASWTICSRERLSASRA